MSSGAPQDVTNSSTWTSSNAAVATVDGTGRVSHVGSGQAEIRATYQNLFGGAIVLLNVTVTAVAVSCTPATGAHVCAALATLSNGTTQDVTNSETTWSSADTNIATVNSTGRVTHISNGQVQIAAKFQNIVGGVVLNLSGVVAATSVSVICDAQPGAHQCQALASFSDGTNRSVTPDSTWTSTNTAVATVDGSGRVTHKSTGQTQIRATYRNMTGSATLDIFVLTMTSITVTCTPEFEAHQCAAVGNFNDGSHQTLTSLVTWKSTKTNVATVDSSGRVRHRSTGQVEIQATFQGVAGTIGLDIVVSGSPTGSSVVINEFATRGAGSGATINEGATTDWVELRNDSNSPIDISGWQLREWREANGNTSVIFTAASGIVLAPGCHYLTAAHSDVGGVIRDADLENINNEGGLALVRADGSIVDQVGYSPNSPFREGTVLPSMKPDDSRSYSRAVNDTNDNANDFVLIGRTPKNSTSSCAVR
jgi:uncharacterized protein YjdB